MFDVHFTHTRLEAQILALNIPAGEGKGKGKRRMIMKLTVNTHPCGRVLWLSLVKIYLLSIFILTTNLSVASDAGLPNENALSNSEEVVFNKLGSTLLGTGVVSAIKSPGAIASMGDNQFLSVYGKGDSLYMLAIKVDENGGLTTVFNSEYDKGKDPSIASMGNGFFVDVHQSENHDHLYMGVFKVGKDGSRELISNTHYDWGINPKIIPMDQDGYFIELHNSNNYASHMYMGVYRVDKDGTIQRIANHKYGDGQNNYMTSMGNGYYLEVHHDYQDIEGASRNLYMGVYKVEVNGTISKISNHRYDSGIEPTIVPMEEDGYFLELHKPKKDSADRWASVYRVFPDGRIERKSNDHYSSSTRSYVSVVGVGENRYLEVHDEYDGNSPNLEWTELHATLLSVTVGDPLLRELNFTKGSDGLLYIATSEKDCVAKNDLYVDGVFYEHSDPDIVINDLLDNQSREYQIFSYDTNGELCGYTNIESFQFIRPFDLVIEGNGMVHVNIESSDYLFKENFTMELPYQTEVTLIPEAGLYTTFGKWEGADCTEESCELTMPLTAPVTAVFETPSDYFNVNLVKGNGVVKVYNSHGELVCDAASSCQDGELYPYHFEELIFEPVADSVASFSHWENSDCLGEVCQTSIGNGTILPKAVFDTEMVSVSLVVAGLGYNEGYVTMNNVSWRTGYFGGACWDYCTYSVPKEIGKTLYFTAMSNRGGAEVFDYWSGACSGGSCSINPSTINKKTNISAHFTSN